ncbi:MAG TPA: arylsulfotransferase family protein, partial [Gaiellales bacterium]
PGYIFVAPKITAPGTTGQQGPEIVDNEGRPVWFSPVTAPDQATDFRVQTYRGRPVLTWNVGASTGGGGHSAGYDVIANDHYKVIATVHAGNGYQADQHEFQLTKQGTALITIYNIVPYDLSSVGGPANGEAYDGIVEEIDVRTGKVLFEWHSLDHVPLSDSYAPVPTSPTTPYDYFHINAVKVASDGNLLIDSRHTWTVYKVNRHTGAIIWRLGGKQSSFKLGPGVPFAWQHDPEDVGHDTLRIFDNESNGTPVLPYSRVIWVHLNTHDWTATLVKQDVHPDHLSAGSQGDAQGLPNGDTFVGWGATGRFSEFDPAGNLLYDASVPTGYDTYRAYRFPWVGEPDTRPTAGGTDNGDGTETIDAVWNGATQVRTWEVLGGSDPHHLHPIGSAPWKGLDTPITLTTGASLVEVVALDAHGHRIGASAPAWVS